MKGGGSSFKFTYAWSPVAEIPQNIDWIDIRKDESTFPHIRCYWLNDEKAEDLPVFMASTIDSASTEALIFVNTKDDFDVDAKFLPPNEECGFPVAVVTYTDGEMLSEIFTKHNRELQARMEFTSVTAHSQAVAIQPAKDDQPTKDVHGHQGLLSLIDTTPYTVYYNIPFQSQSHKSPTSQ